MKQQKYTLLLHYALLHHKRMFRLTSSLLILCILLLYYGTVAHFAVNFPHSDDIDMFLAPLLSWYSEGSTPGDKLLLLFRRHGEHYIVWCRCVALLSQLFWGEVNFRVIVLWGNAALVIVLFLCGMIVRDARRGSTEEAFSSYYLIPIAALLFQPGFYQIVLWPAATVEHLWVMVFVIGAFLCGRSSSWFSTLGAVVFSCMATFTQGNGVLAFFVLGCSAVKTKGYIRAGLFTLLFIFGLFLHQGSAAQLVSQEVQGFDFAWKIFRYVCCFIGAPVSLSASESILVGAVLLCGALYTLVLKAKEPAALMGQSLILFIILTAGVNALARSHLGVTYAFEQSRYIYPALFLLIGMWFYWISSVTPKVRARVSLCGMCASIGMLYAGYTTGLPYLSSQRQILIDAQHVWTGTSEYVLHPDRTHASVLISEAIRHGYLRLTATGDHFSLRVPQPCAFTLPQERSRKVIAHLEYMSRNNNGDVFLRGYGFVQNKVMPLNPLLVFTNEDSCLMITPDIRAYPQVHKVPLSWRDDIGFFVQMHLPEVSKGAYRVQLVYTGEDGQQYLHRFSERVP